MQPTPSCQVLNKRVLCTTHLTQRWDGTQPVLHHAACNIKLMGSFPAEGMTLFSTERQGTRWHQDRRRIWWSGCGAGSTSLMLKDRQKDDQLASMRRWGESCCPCLPKGQRITHVPVSRWKGKFPEACLIILSILNPSLAPLQVWVLVEELLCRKTIQKNQPSPAWQRAGPFCLSSIGRAIAEMVFPI